MPRGPRGKRGDRNDSPWVRGGSDLVHRLPGDRQQEAAMKAVSEAEWQRTVRRWAKDLGWTVYHTQYSIGADRGFPDLVLIRPPKLIFAELKSNKGKMRPEQEDWLNNLRACGLPAYIWRPSDEQIVLGMLK